MPSGGQHLRDEGSKVGAAFAGGLSGLTARLLTAPLDVIKIHLQLRPVTPSGNVFRRKKLSHTVKSIYIQNGIKGFWRGNVSASWLYVVYNTTQFSGYKLLSPPLDQSGLPSALVSTAGGAIAGAMATTAAYPFDLVRTRFAAQGPINVYESFRGSFRTIYGSEGIKGFYRGIGIAVAQGAPYMGLLFGVYEGLRPLLSSLRFSPGSDDALAGAVASLVAKTGTYPLDLIRKRIQVQGPARHRFAEGQVPEYKKGFWRIGKAIVTHEGWQGLYRGLTIGLIKATPTSTISMWSYGLAIRTIDSLNI